MITREEKLELALRLAVHFIEDVTEEDPERTDKFFHARETWREAFATPKHPDQEAREAAPELKDAKALVLYFNTEQDRTDFQHLTASIKQWREVNL